MTWETAEMAHRSIHLQCMSVLFAAWVRFIISEFYSFNLSARVNVIGTGTPISK